MDNKRYTLDRMKPSGEESIVPGHIPDAGYERDKLIGKLRGVRALQADIGSYYYDKTCKYTIHTANWSTDRYIAWQLWDELPAKKRVEEYPNECICAAWDDRSMRKHYETGKDFADAVSITWLRMKGI